ncbi:Multidrug-efflux transporter [uncultured Roseburia sp.]|uniref:Probable multidrug resistance protein NorM n=1 Tax=Brotonthovivens ammoniilytica TaxID=2981725 RepID=A0ABT2TG07_9FIRM|nr:MATE family efflux transporter [Brotonthovivens ammoniilytica]MCU6761124.1 MATE family efflux transporter [Brotonthovivens ammoniilytica]SCI19594.1 Multidrug-efflux transporter [uncultured Roseburia sp.]
MERDTFFTRDKTFYKTLFHLMVIVALQNLVAYSVNMADNIMLGSYDQTALSGAATVNQVFFMVQQVTLAFGEAMVVLGAQYWGQKRTGPICRLTGIALKLGVICGVIIFVAVSIAPVQILGIFSNDAAIVTAGTQYLAIIKYTFILFIITNIIMAALRCVETVNISFYISVVSLLLNVAINYCLIYGKFGLPEMGIRGAAIGTLAARILELLIVVLYAAFRDKKLQLFKNNFLKIDKDLRSDYRKVGVPVILSQVLWAISVPMQTAILGHLSSDAIAANSVATTFYQYLKVIVVAMSSATAVMIGSSVGRGDMKRIKSDARTLEVIDLIIGIVLGVALFALRGPLLQFYNLNDNATSLAMKLIVVMSVVMVGMSYQMPVSMGIIRGGGDARFTMIMNMVSTWAIVIPLSFMSAFWWQWPVVLVVIMIQSDQIFKCLPTFIRMRSYKWIKKLTRKDA